MDGVQTANSGHPGTAMGAAPLVYKLWQDFLTFNPEEPHWINRDRFVLSIGHASMLLYSTLHLFGVKEKSKTGGKTGNLAIPLEDMKRFRQMGSRCAGHPEYGHASGIEMTTGPLGQGLATSVGMAIAAQWLAGRYNKPQFDLFTYDVFAMCGEGCLMEGISYEAASLAGHLKLSNLCWIYDRNRITIEGSVDLAFTEDLPARFEACGWRVIGAGDVNNLDKLGSAFREFKAKRDRPTLIIVDSHIAFGSPHKQDKSSAHGEPLGEEEVKLTKKAYGWPEDKSFYVPDGVREFLAGGFGKRGKAAYDAWCKVKREYDSKYPELAKELEFMQGGALPKDWDAELPCFEPSEKGIATRDASNTVLNAIAKRVPWLLGGSADLAPSTKVFLKFEGVHDFTVQNRDGRNFHYGIREHEMTAATNGLALSGLRAYNSGFLVFSDYARPSIRLSSIMKIPSIHIFTHDSIGVGEDGPTHQPIEHLSSLRAIPGLVVLRPADANEVTEAWRFIMHSKDEPVALILSRQNLPILDRSKLAPASGLQNGAYVLHDSKTKPQVILIATGSEVPLCLEACEKLARDGIAVRLVSMPSWELFDRQSQQYKDSVLPPSVEKRVAVEMASPMGWQKYVGGRGAVLAIGSFGASAPLKDLVRQFRFTADDVVNAVKNLG